MLFLLIFYSIFNQNFPYSQNCIKNKWVFIKIKLVFSLIEMIKLYVF